MTAASTFRVEPLVRTAASGGATLDLVLALVRPRAQRLVALMERAWQAGQTSPDQGLAIAPGEVARLLEADAAASEEAEFAASEPILAALAARAVHAHAELARDPVWNGLCRAFSLDDDEADFLALLAAVEIDPGLQRVVAYLHDDTRQHLPTPMLAARLAGRPRRTWRAPNLARWQLAAPVDGAPAHALTSGWRIDPAVLAVLHDGTWDDPLLADGVRDVGPNESAATLPLQDAALAALERAADMRHVELTGPPGIGRQTLAAQFAAARRRGLLVADLAALAARGVAPREALLRVLRQAALDGAIAYFRDADEVPAVEWTLAQKLGVDFLRGVRVPTNSEIAITLAPLALADRRALWRSLTAAPCPEVIAAQRLTPGEVARLARAPDAPRRIQRPDHHLLARLPCRYDWDDLVLPADVERQLHELVDQIQLRWQVYDGWGFGHLMQMGSGIAALFGGPSGTGKTMAAQVIARALKLELYRVDLAGVVNKYVGETEKKLREVFDACEDTGALLFFDEADALFGGRMEVKDAHDRFARWCGALREASPAGEPLLDAIDWELLADRLTMTGAAIKNTALSAAFLARAEGRKIGMEHVLHAAQRELAKNHEKLPISLRRGGER